MAGLVAVLYGIVAYGVTLVALLYLIGFTGNLIVPKSIDSGTAGPLLQSVILDTLLIALFAIQHSVMARPGFKRWWTRMVPASVERSTYVLFASFALLILYWQWQPIPAPVWTVRNPSAAAVLVGIFWLGWVVLVASTFLLSHFELFGLSQVFARLFGKQQSDAKFRTPLFYRRVRHPSDRSPTDEDDGRAIAYPVVRDPRAVLRADLVHETLLVVMVCERVAITIGPASSIGETLTTSGGHHLGRAAHQQRRTRGRTGARR